MSKVIIRKWHHKLPESRPTNLIVKYEEPNMVEAQPIGTILGANDEVLKQVYSPEAIPKAKGKLGY